MTQDPGGARLRPPPARHLPQELRGNMSRPASAAGRINARPADAAAARARCCRASSSSSACRRQIIVAIWGLETDFGTGDMGKLPVIRVLATMAHDCRRTELFQGELLAALKIVQRGDLPLARPDRRLCRRDRPDPVPAVVLHQVRRRFRRQRPCRPAPQRAGRARLHRQPAQGERLARPARPTARARANFEAMREWNRATIYRKTIALFRATAGGAVKRADQR